MEVLGRIRYQHLGRLKDNRVPNCYQSVVPTVATIAYALRAPNLVAIAGFDHN